MMFTLIQVMANFYYFTWFIWPIAFVFGLAHGIKALIEKKGICNAGLVIASISLLFILAGLMYPILVG